MRIHIDPQTKQILGYYPEEIEYPNLPDESELHTITDEEHQQALAINANKWDGGPSVDTSLYPASDEPEPITIEDRLAQLGIDKHELKKLLAEP